jgi:predicted transcriptional regulator
MTITQAAIKLGTTDRAIYRHIERKTPLGLIFKKKYGRWICNERDLKKFELQELAVALENAKCAVTKVWQVGMKALKISSQQYAKICTAGKKTQEAHNALFVKLSDEIGTEQADELMPSARTNVGFN